MWLHSRLEEIERCRTVRVGSHLFTTCIVHLRHLANEWHYIAQELHQTANAHVLTCTNAEHGEYRACHESLADTLTQFVLCQSLFLEEFLHQAFVVLGGSLHKSLVQLHSLVHFLGWDILDDWCSTLGLP